jgi:two-component system sensor histidine kinase KdpD
MSPDPSQQPEAPRRRAEDFLALINQQKQGKLKIYLGACAGVGKTYQMLVEGNRLRRRGVDVVIGYVEPHARPETTAQIGELETVPPVITHYKGVTLCEMNTAAVIARAPTVALVDELAHTNAPGTKTKKRFEDVEDLLASTSLARSTSNISRASIMSWKVRRASGSRSAYRTSS